MDNLIGQRIKNRRKELNITQLQIQQQTSISSGNLSCIENGKYLPSAIALVELSKILSCSVDWILTGDSSFSNNFSFNIKEKELLNNFRNLPEEEQQEILEITEIKLRKIKKRNTSYTDMRTESSIPFVAERGIDYKNIY